MEARILVVGHGAFIASLIRGLSTRQEYDTGKAGGRIFNTGITTIKLEPSGAGSMLQYSDTAHLQEEQGHLVQTNVDDVDLRAGRVG